MDPHGDEQDRRPESYGSYRHQNRDGRGYDYPVGGSGSVNPRDLLYSQPAAEKPYDYRSTAAGHEAALLQRAHGEGPYRDSDRDHASWSAEMDGERRDMGRERERGSIADYGYDEEDDTGRARKSPPRPAHQKMKASPPARRPSLSHTEAGDAADEVDDPAAPGSKGTTGKRAAQACLRCRRQKLRCLGGWPCDRCKKSKNTCDFGKPAVPAFGHHFEAAGPSSAGNPIAPVGGNDSTSAAAAAAEANARLQQLESSVATLLAGLAGNGATDIPTLKELLGGDRDVRGLAAAPIPLSGAGSTAMRGTDLDLRAFSFSSSTSDGRPYIPNPHPGGGTLAPWQTLPPPLHTRPLEPPRSLDDIPSLSPEAQAGHVRFTSSPHITFGGHTITSPSNHDSSGISPASGLSTAGGSERKEKKLGKGQKAEERLAGATDGEYEAPFKALVYQPAVWDNREQSRRSSPQPSGGTTSRDELSGNTYDRRFGREKDDPVTTGLVDTNMAQTLFNFFVDHCHPFLPIVNVALSDPFQTIRQSPFLISAILAISARFFLRHSARSLAAIPFIDPALPSRLANLAETHLSQTVLRKQHALSDVQAILLMSAWGLQTGGKGPDSWIVTGHAARVARRLGVHKTLARATEQARKAAPGTDEWTKLETFMPQWRTWLTWFCFDGLLSLGFGRPQSTQFETVDEQGFLQLRLAQPIPRPGSTSSVSLYGDVYIAGQVQLTQIGRDLVNWGEMLADPEKAVLDDPRRAEVFKEGKLDIRTMFKELNARLDEWSKLWVWSGSQYSLYLGSSTRIARLQAEHMRLCLNSYALKARPDEDEVVAQCLRKALNAAMSTIQTHFESSQTDQALSFATDYLTITLAQAAVFLIRITKSPASVQAVVNLDPSVVAHYLTMSVTLLETADLSETRLSTYLAKTIRDIGHAAGIAGLNPSSAGPGGEGEGGETKGFINGQGFFMGIMGTANGNSETRGDDGGQGSGAFLSVPGAAGMMSSTSSGGEMGFGNHLNGNGSANPAYRPTADEPFDLESFLQLESQVDLGYLLGLPGDASGGSLGFGFGGETPVAQGDGAGIGWAGWDQGGIGEFEFGGGMSGGGVGLGGWMDLNMGNSAGNGTG